MQSSITVQKHCDQAAHTSGCRVLCPFIKHKGPRTVCVLLQNYSRTWTQLLGIHKTAVSSKLGKCETTNKLTWVKSKSIKKKTQIRLKKQINNMGKCEKGANFVDLKSQFYSTMF